MKEYKKEFQVEFNFSDKKPVGKARKKVNNKVRTQGKKEVRKVMKNGTTDKQ